MQPFQCGGYHNTVDLIVQHLYRYGESNIPFSNYGFNPVIIDENYGLLVLFVAALECLVDPSQKIIKKGRNSKAFLYD